MSKETFGLIKQLREACKRSIKGYPLQITFEPTQLIQLVEILDMAESNHIHDHHYGTCYCGHIDPEAV